ncbi:carbohydrate ABC transporter permease [Streptomyces acidiscabies]|uniref:Carbohydrate ABC transporter permease n=1 Tax=Streptomyces acidiscabies TaxID=42234 RepID=A0AAP6B7J0_9ACTN|nr:carbohydrate ABC transporter permease [Streptomyces acidiscabies]MBZ3910625.1 carbohydrate ABC transporter permease [Streptomyces acidiscabies]MDX2959625.1 carbohydrate ABC transporter permease [Streptomyces acidiscabies]MDX3019087.1 carbohydrate ABC transporter permease [Streptomyces acidiscabies]MDX3790832.1 carbohydrate ABC transporter permease [Streptomyces acidiscabies]GAQ59179.1 trehalose transport system permease protein [Streptomyces acidiscabies]
MTKTLRPLVLTLGAATVVLPLLVVVFGTFKTLPQLFDSPLAPPSSPTLDNYRRAVDEGGLGAAFGNSVIVTAGAVTLTLAVASLAAFFCARIPGRVGWIVFGVLVAGLAVPAQAAIVPQYVLFDRLGLTDSLLGLILVDTTMTLPTAVFILGGFLRTIPEELYEAAELDGAGPLRSFVSIALPLTRPALATTGIFLFVMDWNDLLYPLLFIRSHEQRTLPLALLDFQGEFLTQYPLLFAGVVIASVPVVVVYVLLQKHFVSGLTAGAVRG